MLYKAQFDNIPELKAALKKIPLQDYITYLNQCINLKLLGSVQKQLFRSIYGQKILEDVYTKLDDNTVSINNKNLALETALNNITFKAILTVNDILKLMQLCNKAIAIDTLNNDEKNALYLLASNQLNHKNINSTDSAISKYVTTLKNHDVLKTLLAPIELIPNKLTEEIPDQVKNNNDFLEYPANNTPNAESQPGKTRRLIEKDDTFLLPWFGSLRYSILDTPQNVYYISNITLWETAS